MPTAPAFCDVMRVLAADGKYGNMIVTLLAPDHAHDDGQSLVALASTNKWLYQDEDVQAALGQVQMFHAIPGTEMSIASSCSDRDTSSRIGSGICCR